MQTIKVAVQMVETLSGQLFCEEYLMKTNDNPLLRKLLGVRGDLLRGDSLLALVIFVVVGAFLVNLVVSLWHNMHFQEDLRETATTTKISALVRL